MLILAHTDGLGVDFDQLGQGILKAAGNGDGRAQIDVILREFLRGQGRGRIHGGTGFTDDHIAGLRKGTQQLHGHGLRLPGGGAVADGNVPDLMPAHEAGKHGNGFLLLSFTEGGVDHAGIQHLAGGIHHRDFAAIAVAGVQTHGYKALHRGLHQQGLQVQGEVMNGALAGPFGEGIADLPLDGGENQPVEGILGSGLHKLRYLHGRLQRGTAYQRGAFVAGQADANLQNVLLFAPVDGKNLVIQQPGDGGSEIIVELVYRIRFRISLADKTSPAHNQLPQSLADVRIVGKIFSNDVAGTGNGFFFGCNALFFVYKGQRQLRNVLPILGENRLGQGIQPLFPGNGAPGAALLLVGTVEVLHLGHGGGAVDGGAQFFRKLALVFYGFFHFVSALLEGAQVGQPGFQIPQGGIIHGTVHFLSVPGNKRNGVAFVNQLHHVFNILLIQPQFPGQNFRNGLHDNSPFP